MQETGFERSVPLSTKLLMLFGGFFNLFGWFFFGFGMIFVWIFMGNADFSFIQNSSRLDRTGGVITNIEDAGASENEVPILRYSFEFQTADGITHTAKAYGLWREDYLNSDDQTTRAPQIGDEVPVEYPIGKPERAKINGMRRALFSPIVSFVVLFPLVGLGFVAYGLKQGLLANDLLKRGIMTTGQLTAKDMTGARVNDMPVYKLTFRFTAMDGSTHDAFASTHHTEDLEDEREEKLFYDPANPDRAVMLDGLPGKTVIGEGGFIRPPHPLKVLTTCIVPFLSIIVHGLYALIVIVS